MKKLLTTTALAMTLAFASMAYADSGRDGHPVPPPPFEEGLSKIPTKDADAFRATMKAGHEQDKPLFEQMHKLHEDLKGIMTASTFDKGAFIAKSKELDDLHAKIHANMSETLATALSKLSQDERKTIAEAMKHGPWGKHRHGGPDAPPPPPEDN